VKKELLKQLLSSSVLLELEGIEKSSPQLKEVFLLIPRDKHHFLLTMSYKYPV
tara:strand:+ start:290 stop:448 length:159 start_codon:yes stop_codon:yes gene_type:complete